MEEKMNGKKVVGLGPKMLSKLDVIIKEKMNQGLLNYSYCQAGEELASRIDSRGGGLKEDKSS